MNDEKVMGLAQALDRFVTDGCHISIGGFTVNRNPMAAVYEINPPGKKRPSPLCPLQRARGGRTDRGRLCQPP